MLFAGDDENSCFTYKDVAHSRLTVRPRFHAYQPAILALRDGTTIVGAIYFVLIHMKTTGDQRTGKAEAWAAYREAFQNFSRTARFVQDLTDTENLDRSTVDAAMLALEKAHTVYVARRNALAYFLLPAPARDLFRVPAPDAEPNTSHIRRVAELLWEVSGRPLGSANDDWHRAEEIIRCAAAA